MKVYMNGRRYDSDTAKWVGEYESGTPGDFSYMHEILCRKRAGEFFLYAFGGPASKYSRMVGDNTWTWGEMILPRTMEEARDWAEKHLDADEVDDIFGTKIGVITVSDFKRLVDVFGFDSPVVTAVWNTMEENPNNKREFETIYHLHATGNL